MNFLSSSRFVYLQGEQGDYIRIPSLQILITLIEYFFHLFVFPLCNEQFTATLYRWDTSSSLRSRLLFKRRGLRVVAYTDHVLPQHELKSWPNLVTMREHQRAILTKIKFFAVIGREISRFSHPFFTSIVVGKKNKSLVLDSISSLGYFD